MCRSDNGGKATGRPAVFHLSVEFQTVKPGLHKLGFPKLGFPKLGFHKLGFHKLGFHKIGFHKLGFHKPVSTNSVSTNSVSTNSVSTNSVSFEKRVSLKGESTLCQQVVALCTTSLGYMVCLDKG